MEYLVYILRCSDGSYYVGSTQNIEQRLKAHHDGRAAMYTWSRRPVVLVFSEPCVSESAAVRRERQIKRWSRAKKEALISGDMKALHDLSRRRKIRRLAEHNAGKSTHTESISALVVGVIPLVRRPCQDSRLRALPENRFRPRLRPETFF